MGQQRRLLKHLRTVRLHLAARSAKRIFTVWILKNCLGCDACMKMHAGCVQKDEGMAKIYEDLTWCDTVVFASPVHFAYMTAQLRGVIDRLWAWFNLPGNFTAKKKPFSSPLQEEQISQPFSSSTVCIQCSVGRTSDISLALAKRMRQKPSVLR